MDTIDKNTIIDAFSKIKRMDGNYAAKYTFYIDNFKKLLKCNNLTIGDYTISNFRGVLLSLSKIEEMSDENKELKDRILELTNRVEDLEFELEDGENQR